jgi:hypothetical protein
VANLEQTDITAMLAAWANGNKDALDRLNYEGGLVQSEYEIAHLSSEGKQPN